MSPAQSRLKAAGYHVLRIANLDESCDACAHRRQIAARLRPLELRLACGLHRATVIGGGWCTNFKRPVQ